MEIRVLRYFLTVVREESITKAAEALHITQPTLSRQLAQMEEDMGVRLFDRGTRKILANWTSCLQATCLLTAILWCITGWHVRWLSKAPFPFGMRERLHIVRYRRN